ncbi:ABC transporter permease [Isobaculum melis]|uniref:Putative ABC transport system permease protein n=1 Tax=Isobaculum melis TaxID=142588 RepID=A0A1H9R5R4_9LACT|nr:ABC transporter permease [Isobaculum melis]SER68072.1 putative ABC transport system permease protein [Isobaculum melis]
MNFIKRGLLSVVRKKGKSIILFAVIFVLGNLIAGAISIQQATKSVENTIKTKLGSVATVEFDYESADKTGEFDFSNMTFLSVDQIKKIGEQPAVKYYDYSTTAYSSSKTVKRYEVEDAAIMGGMNQFQVKGIHYAPVLDFAEGKGKIVDGRIFNQEEIDKDQNVAIISDKLAEKNNLHVGDTMVFQTEVYAAEFSENGQLEVTDTRDFVLEIVGIFEQTAAKKEDNKDNKKEKDVQKMFMDTEYLNTIYTSAGVVNAENDFSSEAFLKANPELSEKDVPNDPMYTPIYVLKSPEDIETFKTDIKDLMPKNYIVKTTADEYDSIAAPIKSMSKLSSYVLIVSVIAAVLIIGLVVLLFLRDRKHELGIYLSLGERKGKVLGQVMLEVLIVSIVGITLSVFSGNYLARGVSDTLLQSQTEETSTNEQMFSSMGSYALQTDVTTEDVAEAYQVKLDSNYVLLFYGIGLGAIFLSTAIPLIYIVRLNPKKIMM